MSVSRIHRDWKRQGEMMAYTDEDRQRAQAESAKAQAEIENLLRKVGHDPRLRKFKHRISPYCYLRKALKEIGYSDEDADEFLCCFMLRHIDSFEIRKIHSAIFKAQGSRMARKESDLMAVIDAWNRLPEAVRVGMTAMARAAVDL